MGQTVDGGGNFWGSLSSQSMLKLHVFQILVLGSERQAGANTMLYFLASWLSTLTCLNLIFSLVTLEIVISPSLRQEGLRGDNEPGRPSVHVYYL